MTTIVITRDNTGKLCGAGSKDTGAYARFRKRLEALEPGEIMEVSYWAPRAGGFHRFHFAVLHAVWENQEQLPDFEQFRLWCQVGAGHVRWVPGPKGKAIALPESIAWRKLDEEDFKKHHESVIDFLRSPACLRFLWPAITDAEAADGMERILEGFQKEAA